MVFHDIISTVEEWLLGKQTYKRHKIEQRPISHTVNMKTANIEN